MPHVTGNYSETEQNQIAHLFLGVCFLCIGLATLCYTAANQVTLYAFSHYSSLSLFPQILKCSPSTWHNSQNNLFSTLYNSKYVSLQHSICIQKPKQNTHIHKTTKYIFKQNDWATVEQHIGNLLWSTLGLFICLGCLVDNQLICNDNKPKRLKWGHSLRLCW